MSFASDAATALLTPRQQLVLDHLPSLETAPHLILHELGLPRAGESPP